MCRKKEEWGERMPKYENHPVYQELANLSEAARVPVRYVKANDDIYAQTKEHSADS